ncbi:DUF1653 domain-containing protein [uncultured Roseobacter sp.]|uniref:DUF1653 domain-containing protein n=1 Tax=uncultured Roseobacter sp. TaxID=114847 RepID=UPI0026376AE6|nr:DUF1653 domain-containing protein [uncultured Roseobacter sp.]
MIRRLLQASGRILSGWRATAPPAATWPDTNQPGGDAIWTPTHRHRKGGLYRVLSEGILEADRSAVVIYDDADGTVWVRASSEFWDGRFTAI